MPPSSLPREYRQRPGPAAIIRVGALVAVALLAPVARLAAQQPAAPAAPPAGTKSAAVAKPPSPELREALKRVAALFEQNRFAEAARLCEQLVKENRDVVDAWLALAHVHLANEWGMRRDARAESAARRALQLGGRKPEILEALATALFRQVKYDECAPILAELIEANPQIVFGEAFSDLLVIRASLALKRDALDPAARERARKDLARAIANSPNHAIALALQAELRIGDGDCTGALGDLERAVVLSPGDKAIHHQLQVCFQRLNRRDEAKLHYEIWRLLNQLTDSLATTNAPDLKTRRELLAQLKKLNPTDFVRRVQLAEHELALGEVDAALAECDELLAKRAGYLPAEHLRGEALKVKAGGRASLPSSEDDGGDPKKDGGGGGGA